MNHGMNRDLDLTARKRRITGKGENPFRKGSFHNDVPGTRPKKPNFTLARKIMDGGLSSLESVEIPDLTEAIKDCCNELVTKKTED